MSSSSESEGEHAEAPQAVPAYDWAKLTSAQEAQLKAIYGSFEDGSAVPWEVRSALGADASAMQDNQREFFLDPANPISAKDAKATFDVLADLLKAPLKKKWKEHLKQKDTKEAYADASARMTKEIALLTAPPAAVETKAESPTKRDLESKPEPPAKKQTTQQEPAPAPPKPSPKPQQSPPTRPQSAIQEPPRVPRDIDEIIQKESEERAKRLFEELTGGGANTTKTLTRPAPLSSGTHIGAGTVRNAESVIRRLESTKY
jgi:hypothetical protein